MWWQYAYGLRSHLPIYGSLFLEGLHVSNCTGVLQLQKVFDLLVMKILRGGRYQQYHHGGKHPFNLESQLVSASLKYLLHIPTNAGSAWQGAKQKG